MYEVLPGTAENVLGFKAVGKITPDDYKKTLDPAIDAYLKDHDGVRIVLELGPEWEGMTVGAMWDDLKLGLSKVTKWKRIAVVTDRDWLEHATKAFGWATPGEVKVFETGEVADALTWAAAD